MSHARPTPSSPRNGGGSPVVARLTEGEAVPIKGLGAACKSHPGVGE